MLIDEDTLREMCKLNDIALTQADKITQSAIVATLNISEEDFIYFCKNCHVSVMFYNYEYYNKEELTNFASSYVTNIRQTHPDLAKRVELKNADWLNKINSSDFSRPNKLTLVASIDGIVTAVESQDNWLDGR